MRWSGPPARSKAGGHFPGRRRPVQAGLVLAYLVASLMRAQMGVTLSALLPAAAIVLAYPLLAALSPGLGTDHVFGVPLSLIILGGAIYPPLVLLGLWYVRRTERVERRFVDTVQRPRLTVSSPATVAAIVARHGRHRGDRALGG